MLQGVTIAKRPHSDSRGLVRTIAGLLLAAGLLWLAFRSVNLNVIVGTLLNLGPLCALVLIPSIIAIVTETWAWRQTFGAFGRMPALLPLLRIRIITEAAATVLPLGPLWSEGVKPHLLHKHCGMDLAESLTGMAARKYLLLLSQGFYLLLGVVLGYSAFVQALLVTGHNPALVNAVFVSTLLLVTLAELLANVLGGGSAARRLIDSLQAIPIRSWRRVLAGCSHRISQIDTTAVRFFKVPWPRRWWLSLHYLGAWLAEAFETWMILTLVGAPITFVQALAVETVVVLARHILFALPAGLGAQELGYAAFLGALGISVEQCAAFALLKRAKELLWALLGYVLFTAEGARMSKPSLPVDVLSTS
jgi:uncharacterized protein (TIRG00374 family)